MNWRGPAQSLAITIGAIASSLVLFGLFIFAKTGISPFALYKEMYIGSFGSTFSWQNSLSRAAPLILTALCTALPARLGLIIIGGEGALVLGGLAAASAGILLGGVPVFGAQLGMLTAGMIAGGLLIAFAGLLRHYRGVNETISSLLLTYIAIAVFKYLIEGPLRDPASSNKPATYPIAPEMVIGKMFGMDVHWGLALGVIFCVFSYVLMEHTTYGFAARMVGGNVRAAQAAGVPVGRLVLLVCLLAGAAAGLAGAVEVAAVHRQANASMIVGYGYTGILVSFIARHHSLGILPVAVLFGGLTASSGVLQRHLELPDASVDVLKGIMFVMILLFETLYGRFQIFQPPVETVHHEKAQAPSGGKVQEVFAK